MSKANQVLARYVDFNKTGQPAVMASDQSGNLFVAGWVLEEPWGNGAIRIVKTDPSGNTLATFDIAVSNPPGTPVIPAVLASATVDMQGNVVIAGEASGFQLVNPLFKTGGVFVIKVDALLQKILFSTQLGGAVSGSSNLLGSGGSAFTTAAALTVDTSGNIYVAGATDTTDFPVTASAYLKTPVGPYGSYGFVTEISSDGSKLLYSTYFGAPVSICNATGLSSTHCSYGGTGVTAIAVDSSGAVTIAGSTASSSLPVAAGAYLTQCTPCAIGGTGEYLARLNPADTALTWATYFPVVSSNFPLSIDSLSLAIDGSAIFSGASPQGLPVTAGVVQPSYPDPALPAGFVAKMDSAGKHLLFATYLGAFDSRDYSSSPVLNGPVMDVAPDGRIWVTGASPASDLPLPAGTMNFGPMYALALSSDGTAITDAFTGPPGASGIAIVTTPQGTVTTLGSAGSLLVSALGQGPSLITFSNSASFTVSGYVAPLELVSFYGIGIGPGIPLTGEIVNEGTATSGPNNLLTTSLGSVQVLFNGYAAPLLYAGPNQINAIVPSEIYGQDTTSVQIVTPQGTINGPSLTVKTAQPDIFRSAVTTNLASSYYAAALNQDGTINTQSNPAAPGTIVTVWGSGQGFLSCCAFQDGFIYPLLAITSGIDVPVSVLSVADNYESLEVLYAAGAPGLVQGVLQVNFRLPEKAVYAAGEFCLQVGTQTSDTFHIWTSGT